MSEFDKLDLATRERLFAEAEKYATVKIRAWVNDVQEQTNRVSRLARRTTVTVAVVAIGLAALSTFVAVIEVSRRTGTAQAGVKELTESLQALSAKDVELGRRQAEVADELTRLRRDIERFAQEAMALNDRVRATSGANEQARQELEVLRTKIAGEEEAAIEQLLGLRMGVKALETRLDSMRSDLDARQKVFVQILEEIRRQSEAAAISAADAANSAKKAAVPAPKPAAETSPDFVPGTPRK